MIQHTHTHNRTKKKDSSDETLSPVSVPEDSPTMALPQQKTYLPENRVLPPHMYYQPPMRPPSPVSEQYSQLQRPWPVYYSPNTPPQFHHPDVMLPPPTSPPVYGRLQPLSPLSHTTDYCYITSPVDSTHKRRLSHADLSTPIQALGTMSKQGDSSDDDDDYDERQMSPISFDGCTKTRFRYAGVDITADEYEALQGFSKFCTEPVVKETIKLPPLNSIYTGPHAFRQHISTVQESFQRGAN